MKRKQRRKQKGERRHNPKKIPLKTTITTNNMNERKIKLFVKNNLEESETATK